jgi:hypothetical protein
MLAYPVRVQRRSYRGSDDPIKQAQIAELNRVAGILEDYLNKQIEERKEEHQKYVYSKIAADLGFEVELVRSILFSLAHGDKYFIVHKLRPIPRSTRQK